VKSVPDKAMQRDRITYQFEIENNGPANAPLADRGIAD
jgi:hypothetical protein